MKDLKKQALILIEETVDERDFRSMDFLLALTTLLEQTETDPKNYIRLIKKAIKHLERNFHEDYLLISREENGSEVFYEDDNRLFLQFAEDLANILNHHDYHREPEDLNQLSGKINLGYQRYFKQKNKTILKFIPEEQIYETISDDSAKTTEIIKDSKKLNKLKKQLKHFPEKIYDPTNIEELEIQISLFGKENLDIQRIDAVTIQNPNNVETAIAILNLK